MKSLAALLLFVCCARAAGPAWSCAVTNTDQTIPIAFPTCNDFGQFVVNRFDTQDPRRIYGIDVQVFDSGGRITYEGWVSENYVPAVAETTTVLLAPGTAAVRCVIFGPALEGKWSGARFDVHFQWPVLRIKPAGGNVQLTWDGAECWALECREPGGAWVPSPTLVPIGNRMALFRLSRTGFKTSF